SLVFGLLYTLPNFFGESPAIQVSPLRAGTTLDTDLLKRVEQLLGKHHIAFNGSLLEPGGIKIRFADTDTQMKARDFLEAEIGKDFIIALNLLPNSPQWMSRLGALPMYLGLDLRGGVHFMLQVDMVGALSKSLDRYSADIRNSLRELRIPSAGVEREGSSLLIKFRDAIAREKAMV